MKGRNPGTLHVLALGAGLGIAIGLAAGQAFAATTPPDKCEATKNKVAGQFAACLHKAEQGFVSTGDMDKYTEAQESCRLKMLGGFGKAENTAENAGFFCPTVGDRENIRDFIEACTGAVADALETGTLPVDVATCNEDFAVCSDDLDACSADLAQSEDDLADCDAERDACFAETTGLKKTGQTSCYNVTTGATISCAGTGQDGEFQKGLVHSYTDNGNGTITDNRTGLMWEKHSDNGNIHDKDNQYSFTDAVARIATLNAGSGFAGYTDWRIPNRRELESLTDIGRQQPAIHPVFHTGCVPGCNGIICSCTRNDTFWSSSAYLPVSEAGWSANFYDGDIYAQYWTDQNQVRAVRDAN